MKISVRFDGNRLQQFYLQIPKAVPKGIARGLNRAGAPTKTRFVREVKRSLGIGRPRGGANWRDPFKSRSVTERATPAKLRYRLTGVGGPIPLKYFNASETRAGVSATPLGQRRVFSSTFTKGGRFPNRRGGIGGHVWQRVGKKRFPIEKQFGPSLPDGFELPAPARAWENEGGSRAHAAIIRELEKILRGHAPA